MLIAGTDVTDPDREDKLNLGKTLGLAGVSLQMAGFGLFSVAAARFHFTSRRLSGEYAKGNQVKTGMQRDWSRLLLVVNASCVLILVSARSTLLDT